MYLFSKNRTEPFDGDTNLYRIGDHADNYQADFISNFNTCTTHEKLCWITSAALSPDRTKLVLLDSERLWLFENWQNDNFLPTKMWSCTPVPIISWSVCFLLDKDGKVGAHEIGTLMRSIARTPTQVRLSLHYCCKCVFFFMQKLFQV